METNSKIPKTINEKSCFVIMPFEGWFNSYYEEIYSPAIKEAGLVPKRADDLYRVGNIVNDIWNYTKEAEVILADLTGRNPNVFYKLGLAHAMSKTVVLLTSTMDDVPYDLRSQQVIEFDKNLPNWGNKLKEKISVAIKEALRSPEDAVPPTFHEKQKAIQPKVQHDENDILISKSELSSFRADEGETRAKALKKYLLTSKEESRISNLIQGGFGDDTIFEILKKDIPFDKLEESIEKLRKERKNLQPNTNN